jgi:hypothetical protein
MDWTLAIPLLTMVVIAIVWNETDTYGGEG